jgi:hypothetical protein
MQHLSMAQYLVLAMKGRGTMSNPSIYREVEKLCNGRGRELPFNWKAEIRETLQAHCPSRPQWNRSDDFFVWHGRAIGHVRSSTFLASSRFQASLQANLTMSTSERGQSHPPRQTPQVSN